VALNLSRKPVPPAQSENSPILQNSPRSPVKIARGADGSGWSVVIVMGGMAVMIGGKLVGEKAGPGGDQGHSRMATVPGHRQALPSPPPAYLRSSPPFPPSQSPQAKSKASGISRSMKKIDLVYGAIRVWRNAMALKWSPPGPAFSPTSLPPIITAIPPITITTDHPEPTPVLEGLVCD
jgi:hypothetical protein